MRLVSALACCLLLTGCPDSKPTPSAADPSGATPTDPSGATTASVAVLPLPPSAERSSATHLSPTTPPSAAKCTALPAGSGTSHELARVIRELACTPGLFYQPAEQVSAALKLPPDVTFRFSGPRTAELRLKTAPTGKQLAEAMGISAPVITTAKGGAWATRNWYLGSDAKTGDVTLWGPGIAAIGVSHRGELKDTRGTIKPLTDENLNGYIAVTMPDSVVSVKDDEVAQRMLLHAVTKLAASPALLNKEPEEIAKLLGLDDARFRVTRVSIGTGPDSIKGVDLWVARSQIAAEPVIKSLGLTGKIEHERAHDSDSIVLHFEPTEKFTSGDDHRWKGLTLKPTFEPRKGVKLGDDADPKDYVLEGLQVMPGKAMPAP